MNHPLLETVKVWLPVVAQGALITWIAALIVIGIFWGGTGGPVADRKTVANECVVIDGYKVCEKPTH